MTLQRLCDILFSLIAIVILAPLLISVSVILKFTGEGEILFGQPRVGWDGKTFRLLKFATMLKESPNIGSGTVTLKDDPRVLPVGKFLRKTKINELPQLLNVLRGDMSLIGPRPQTMRCFNAFPELLQSTIVSVKPGLSGIGSLYFRDEEKLLGLVESPEAFYDDIIMPYKGELEFWYTQNQSIFTYFKLIFHTVWQIVMPSPKRLYSAFPELPQEPMQLKAVNEIR